MYYFAQKLKNLISYMTTSLCAKIGLWKSTLWSNLEYKAKQIWHTLFV